MKLFVKKLFILFLSIALGIIVLICFHYFVIGSQYRYNYMAAALDKIHRLENINEPKIILVGNSNLAFGIDSGLIEERTGMPVVNLGLQGSIGNEFHERMALYNICPDDIVVICHTSYSDDDTIGNAVYALMAWDCHNELLQMFRVKDYYELIKAYPTFFRGAFSLWLSGNGNEDILDIYSRGAFNEYGDIVYKPEYGDLDDNEMFSHWATSPPVFNDTCINRLNALDSYVSSKEASMVVAAYPIGYGEYSRFTPEDYMEFQRDLDDALSCDVISDFTDYFYPYELFYNTPYHLDEEGTRIRSIQLSDDISAWLDIQADNYNK